MLDEILIEGLTVLIEQFSPVELTKRTINRTTDTYGNVTAVNTRDEAISGIIVPITHELIEQMSYGFEATSTHAGIFYKSDGLVALDHIFDANGNEYEIIKTRTDWSLGGATIHTIVELRLIFNE